MKHPIAASRKVPDSNLPVASGVTYQNMLPETHFDDAAELYESAFGQKFSRAIQNRSDRIALIRDGFKSDFAITAFHDDRLVGLAGYHTQSGYLTSGMTGRAILRRLGLVRGIRACLILSLYERTPAPGELVMDGVAVLSTYRGRGIGTELLERIIRFAAKHGYLTVRLDVIDSNPSARKLYERFGFEVTRQESYPYLSSVLGFSGSASMEYRIQPRT